ncbi:MAG: hypothetical protein GF308_12975 [Candidatus Heimdallarchaeota archaeon]|nr:hypothetical protein [Candidatus Heimdallarchaeota archaeon]
MALSVNFLLLLPIIIPFLGGILLFGFRKWIKGFAGEISVAVIIILVMVIAAITHQVNETASKIVYGIYNTSQGIEYGPPIGVQIRADGFSSWFLLFISIIEVCILMWETNKNRDDPNTPLLFSLSLFLIAGINGVLFSYDFFTLFLSWTIITIALIVLIGFDQQKKQIGNKIAITYKMLGLALALMLFAIVLCYGIFGTLNFDFVKKHSDLLSPERAKALAGVISLCIALIITAFGILAHFCFINFWMPETIEDAPTSTKVFITTIVSGGAVFSIIQTLTSFFPSSSSLFPNYPLILGIIGIITTFEGVLLIIGEVGKKEPQEADLSKIIIYSTFVNIGIILTGLTLGSFGSLTGTENSDMLTNLVGYSTLQIINFMVSMFLCLFSTERLSRKMENSYNLFTLQGAMKKLPLTTFILIIALLSLGGCLPTLGGVTIYMILFSFIKSGYFFFAILIGVALLLVLFYYFKIIKVLLWEKSSLRLTISTNGISADISFPTIVGLIVALGLLFFGIVPSPIITQLINGLEAILP